MESSKLLPIKRTLCEVLLLHLLLLLSPAGLLWLSERLAPILGCHLDILNPTTDPQEAVKGRKEKGILRVLCSVRGNLSRASLKTLPAEVAVAFSHSVSS